MQKQLTLAKNIIQSNKSDFRLPYKLNFNLTNKCNSKCLTCNIWQIKSSNELTTEELEKFFANYNRFVWIDMTGGEVFLRKDVVEVAEIILKYCKNLYHLHIPTNVIKNEITVEYIKQIIKLRPYKFTVTFSLDGPEETHDHIRGVPGNFQSVIEAYKELESYQSKRFEIFFGFTLSKLNFGKFPETVKKVREIFPKVTYKNFHMNLAHSSENYYKNTDLDLGVSNNFEIINKEFEFFRQRKKELFNPINFLENLYLIYLKKYLKTGVTPMDCKSLSSSVYLDPYGNIFPCSIWDNRLGNIRDFNYDLNLILNKESVPEIKNKILNKDCPNCWTPCEAYQTIFGNLGTVVKRTIKGSKHN